MSASKTSLTYLKQSYFQRHFLLQGRNFAKLVRKQDPEEVKNMPIFQYATKNTKRSRRIYMWGNAACGALGNASFVRPRIHKFPLASMNRPWRLPFADFHKVRDVSCGYGFTVFAASNDENDFSLFGTGLNSDFQIGYQCGRKGNSLEALAEPVPIALPLYNLNTKALKVGCGRAHTVVITDKEGIFSLGNNSYGQCGVPFDATDKSDNIKVYKVEGLSEDVSEVVCGQDHTLFLTTSGKVYSCGWSADGQTGLGHYSNQFTPARVKGDIEGEKIVQISCAADCVLAVSDKGDVFGWGNSEYQQLNLATSQQQLNIPKHINLGSVGKVKQVASGGTMCAVLNDQGHLYMWGRNRSDCLGLGREKDQYFPYKVAVPAEVLKISCGVDHTAALCRSFA
ncbi:RCC1-like G exchanging factor-like protein isoform X2 [Stegodyphus dumicola]|uniref:RCC1-like G exchanging factor-like protein isoform X2 n=1 Tax=Stegodyphus dumicola TaxID=202533 RepID=UPI0015AB13F9|nr:RCC1-like G exchanging factor-like protein isoform X2 [Stegodyphus dumicola]